MTSPALFDVIDSRLRKLKGRFDRRFRGLHIVFCGDFYQLPPIGPCIYKLPTATETSQDNHAIATIRGIQLWKDCLSDVIELTENHRQADPKWAASLERWRINQPTAQDLIDVNARFIRNESSELVPPPHTIIAVSQNVSREEGIRYIEKKDCQNFHHSLIVIKTHKLLRLREKKLNS